MVELFSGDVVAVCFLHGLFKPRLIHPSELARKGFYVLTSKFSLSKDTFVLLLVGKQLFGLHSFAKK